MKRHEEEVRRNSAPFLQQKIQVGFKVHTRYGSCCYPEITSGPTVQPHCDKMSDSQKDFSIHCIRPAKADPENYQAVQGGPYFNGRELTLKFDQREIVYAHQEHILRLYQVGMMEIPRFGNPDTLANITVVVILNPIFHVPNLYYLIGQLPNVTLVEINYKTKTLELFDYQLHKPIMEMNNSELLNKSVSRFFFLVEISGFRQQPDEVRLPMSALFANIIVCAISYFPGIRQLNLELPDDPNLTTFKSVHDMVRKIPAINQAVIKSDPYNSKISCLYSSSYPSPNGNSNGHAHNTVNMNNSGGDVPQLQLTTVVNGPHPPPPPPPPVPTLQFHAMPAPCPPPPPPAYHPYTRPAQKNGGTAEQFNRMPTLAKERRIK